MDIVIKFNGIINDYGKVSDIIDKIKEIEDFEFLGGNVRDNYREIIFVEKKEIK